MCGIVGYVGAQQAAPILLEGLQKLEYRGYDSAGIAVLDGSTIELAKACGEIKNLLAKTHDGSDLHGYIGLGHTRWATHGAPTEANAHPHVSNDGKFAIVQNGIIENFMELREMLQAKGFRFHSETDTEVIVHLLDMYYTGDGNLKDTVLKTLGRLEGSYAIGILCADCPEQMFLARNGCPLIIGVGAGENFFASDVTALVSHTKNVVYLDDGELAEVRADGYTVFDCTGKPVHKPVSRVAWDIEAAEKGGYEHFMLKEIMEQPRAIKSTLDPRVKDHRVVFDELKMTDEQLMGFNKIMITACGSAFYAGQAGKYPQLPVPRRHHGGGLQLHGAGPHRPAAGHQAADHPEGAPHPDGLPEGQRQPADQDPLPHRRDHHRRACGPGQRGAGRLLDVRQPAAGVRRAERPERDGPEHPRQIGRASCRERV